MTIEFRRMQDGDMGAILRIQAANYVGNLTPEGRARGFLSAVYTPDELNEMANDAAVMVAAEDGRVIAFVCAYSAAFGARFPIVARMIARFGEADFEGRPLSERSMLIYGPVAVDRRAQGHGAARGMFEQLKREMKGRFDAGAALIAEDNTHSRYIHTQRFVMSPVGDFEHQGKRFTIVAFAI